MIGFTAILLTQSGFRLSYLLFQLWGDVRSQSWIVELSNSINSSNASFALDSSLVPVTYMMGYQWTLNNKKNYYITFAVMELTVDSRANISENEFKITIIHILFYLLMQQKNR